AGAYICGEETSLLNSLEGERGFPRLKPPFPAVKGLFGNPTIVNNVETLMNVPAIVDKGGAWFNELGTGRSGGTRIVCVSGHVATDIPMAVWRIMKFFAHESCGQCTPCREGTGWLEKVSRRVAYGNGQPDDIELLASISHGIAGNTICALGDAAAWPMLGFLT